MSSSPPLQRRWRNEGDKVAAVILLDFHNTLNLIKEEEPALHDEEERLQFLSRYGHAVHSACIAKRANARANGKSKDGDSYIVWDDPDFYNEL